MKPLVKRMILLNLVLLLLLSLVVISAFGSSELPYTIMLDANGGQFSNGNTTQTTKGTVVTLPEHLNFENEDTLLGWCIKSVLEPTDLYHLSGPWFSGGTDIQPTKAPIVLYAHANNDGRYAIYHPTEGVFEDGGNMMVFGTTITTTDLINLTTPDESSMVAPIGYEFAGWATADNVDYAAGTELTLAPETTIHLYAQWKEIENAVQLSNGLRLSVNNVDRTVQIYGETHAARMICAFYAETDQLLSCEIAEIADEKAGVRISYPKGTEYLQVFLLDKDYAPVEPVAAYPSDRAQ